MAPLSQQLLLVAIFLCMKYMIIVEGQGTTGSSSTTWCVARSDASSQALQTALDYACGAGADCTPIQSNGLCYLPNTIQAHASYAFNSYYQRKSMAPGSCDFSGTATVAKSDPSYGSCVYPSSLSTAGGTPTQNTSPTSTTTNNPNMPTSTTPLDNNGGNGLNPAGYSPPISTTSNSKASKFVATTILMPVLFSVVLSLSLTFPYMLVL